MCTIGLERRLKWLWEEEERVITAVAFQSYRKPFKTVKVFKYLGRVLTASYDNWLAVVKNIRKLWRRWARLSRILGW